MSISRSKNGCSSDRLVRCPLIVTERLTTELTSSPGFVAAMAVDKAFAPRPSSCAVALLFGFAAAEQRTVRLGLRPPASRALCLRATRRLTISATPYFLRKASSETTSAPFWALSAASATGFLAPAPPWHGARISWSRSAGTFVATASGFFCCGASTAAAGDFRLDVEFQLEVHRRVVEAAHRREWHFQLLRHVGEREADLEAGVGDLQIPILELQHDRHLLGIAFAQAAGYAHARRIGEEGDEEMMVAGQASPRDLDQHLAHHAPKASWARMS